jgi:DNA-binding GntR family transcriptional regulator
LDGDEIEMTQAPWNTEMLQGGDAASVVEAKLRELILMGGFEPGTPLNQEALAEDFGVSRMPIRQALRRLQAEGLVERLQNRRVQVAELRRDEIEDIFDMRISLEPMALRLAISRATKLDIRAMSRALEDAADDGDPATFGLRNTAYHMAILRPCGRQRLLGTLHSLLDLSDRYQRAAYNDRTFMAPLNGQHELILDAIRNNEPDAGAEVLEQHIRGGRDRLVELFS